MAFRRAFAALRPLPGRRNHRWVRSLHFYYRVARGASHHAPGAVKGYAALCSDHSYALSCVDASAAGGRGRRDPALSESRRSAAMTARKTSALPSTRNVAAMICAMSMGSSVSHRLDRVDARTGPMFAFFTLGSKRNTKVILQPRPTYKFLGEPVPRTTISGDRSGFGGSG
jgi:hypothetical protein